jgi:hypothetical protein
MATPPFRSLLATFVAVLAVAVAPSRSQAPAGAAPASDAAVPACDTASIGWVLPGRFPAALARARAERRILLIKGISFGVDEAGATCATKGVW